MENRNRIITSESVTEGHPDKICDQISDAVLDAILVKDREARVACETIVTTGLILVMGEITTDCYVDIPAIARGTVQRIGYDRPEYGFDGKSCAVLSTIDEQSPDIALGVDISFEAKTGEGNEWGGPRGTEKPFRGERRSDGADELSCLHGSENSAVRDDVGAGDQGMMFGFACRETPEYMPAPITFAHSLTKALAQARKSGELPWLRPDGKSQVSVQYGASGEVERISAVVLSAQHGESVDQETLREAIMDSVIYRAIPKNLIDRDTKVYINPTGRFVIGGPVGDSGLTGRKIIVDTYGGYISHGGGAFSGKDPTKVDRSGAYMARYAAKNIVAAGLAERCQVEIAYAIGVAKPVSLYVSTLGTGKIPDERIAQIVNANFDFRPAKIIGRLDLRRPIYTQTAAYGHFGRPELDLPWEKTDVADALRNEL